MIRRVIRSHVEGRRDVARERRYQRRYAKRHGYFWLPCPICGEEFGGHEFRGSIPIPGEPGKSEGICPSCVGERQTAAEEELARLGVSRTTFLSRWGGRQVTHRIGVSASGYLVT